MHRTLITYGKESLKREIKIYHWHSELDVDSPRFLHNVHETIGNRSFLCPVIHSPEKTIYLFSVLGILCSDNPVDEFNWHVWIFLILQQKSKRAGENLTEKQKLEYSLSNSFTVNLGNRNS